MKWKLTIHYCAKLCCIFATVVFNDEQIPSAQSNAKYLCHLGCYHHFPNKTILLLPKNITEILHPI